MTMITYANRAEAAAGVATTLAEALRAVLAQQDRATLAVPGGTTPGPVFDALSLEVLDWNRVCVLATDERWVPLDDPRSNARLIRERLLQGPAQAAHLVPFFTGAASPEPALPALARALDPVLPVSVLLLGMGADMHTASLFPGVAGLDAALAPEAPPVAVLRPESQPEARLSLTAPVLNAAVHKHLLIFGQDKRAALDRAQDLPATEAPIAAVLDNLTRHWAD